jgi:signal transduction histidine kinase/ActR/RegA family two-component response regulator
MKRPDPDKKPELSDDPVELRHRAEPQLKGRQREAAPEPAAVESERQRHELEVHQIELQLQNAELLAARAELEAALEKYTDLYDFAPVGYLALNPEGVIREANLTGASLLGIARSALVNQRFGSFIIAADRPAFVAFLQRVFASKVRQSCEVTLQVPGRPPLMVGLEAISFESGSTGRLTLTDVTERKRAEADRLILSKLESTGVLAGGIAHDFNNLLTVILMNLELGGKAAASEKAFGQHLEQAIQAVSLARGLTQQLITFNTGGTPIRKPTALAAVIQESARLALSGSRVRCEFVPPPDLWPADVDPGQIGQVIHNLVLNAREAMPAGGVVTVRAKNVVLKSSAAVLLPPGDYVRVSITDQGSGMTKELLQKIFDPYFSTKQRGDQKGMGLGLTICHTIIKKHGGAIAVESEMDAGTTFHIHLPVSGKLSLEEPAPLPEVSPRCGRILVMDDEEPVREVVGASLQGMGHEVVLVGDGAQAVEVYEKSKALGRPFDAVILDLTVKGGIGGREAISQLLQLDPGVRAIVMSGYSSDTVLMNPESHGFQGVLTKPFNSAELREVLAQVMGDRSRTQPTP